MIVETIIYTCRKCKSEDITKNGTNRCGSPQYHCKNCGAYGVLVPKERYSKTEKDTILKAYQERSSMRGIERTFGVCRQTLAIWLKIQNELLPPLSDTLSPVEQDQVPVLELDELWSFVYCKKNRLYCAPFWSKSTICFK